MADPVDIFAEEKALKDAVDNRATAPAANPYPPGSEEASWYADQLTSPPPPSAGFAAGLPPTGYGPTPAPKPAYRGAILPLTRDSSGNISFTPLTAGPVGSMVEAAQLPGRVASGEIKVDPGDPNFMGQALNTAATFGGVNPMIRSGDRIIPGAAMAPKNPLLAATPGGGELLQRGGEQHKAFRELPIQYNPQHMPLLADKMEQALIDSGVFPEDAKGLYKTIRRLRTSSAPDPADPGSVVRVTPSSLMSIRDNITNKFDAAAENKHGVGKVLRVFDDFMEKPPQGAVLAGPAEFGAKIYGEGRANMAAGHRDADLAAIQREAGLRTGSANSGLNLDNTLRSRIASAVLNAKRMKGFTPTEEALLEQVPEGSTKTNLQRRIGNTLGGGGGIGGHAVGWSAAALGSYMGLPPALATPLGFAAPMVGEAFKRAAGKSTNEAINEIRTATRQRSPVFRQTPYSDMVPDPTIALSPRDRMAREISRTMVTGGQGVPLPPITVEEP